MFTGSFHPVEDSLWENRKAWDKRVEPEDAVTLREIFERRSIIRMAATRQSAIKVLNRVISFLGKDIVSFISEYLNDEDCCMLVMAAKVRTEKQQPVVINQVPLPSPSTSLFYGL